MNCLFFFAPDLCTVKCDDTVVLDSPIGKSDSINTAIIDKVNALKIIVSRLCYLNRHDALHLLRHSFAIPKILYIL